AQFLGIDMSLLIELVNQLAHCGLIAPLRITLKRTLGRHSNSVQFAQPAEVLEERAVGQANSKTAKIFHDQSASDIAAKSTARMDLDLTLGFGRDLLRWRAGNPAFKSRQDELLLDAALKEKLIDTDQLRAQTFVVNIAFDRGQGRCEQLLKRKNLGWHEARL